MPPATGRRRPRCRLAEDVVDDADLGLHVFLTSFLPAARRALAIEVADIRGRNPDIMARDEDRYRILSVT